MAEAAPRDEDQSLPPDRGIERLRGPRKAWYVYLPFSRATELPIFLFHSPLLLFSPD